MRFARGFRDRVASALADLAAISLYWTAFMVVVTVADRAPEFAAIVVGASLIALAIWKRPAARTEIKYSVGAMEVDSIDAVWLDREVSLAVLKAAAEKDKANG